MRLGVHVSIGKGFKGAIDQAEAVGCDGFQIFAGNPRGWSRNPVSEKAYTEFKDYRQTKNLWPVVVHLAYLPNPATLDPELGLKSFTVFKEDFRRANQLGADFFVFHPGKAKERLTGIKQVIAMVNRVLAEVEGPTAMLFENQSGSGSEIAGSFSDLGLMLKEIKWDNRVGICFDTCHAFAAGYDLRNRTGWERTLTEFEEQIGLAFLKMFHLNDSVGGLGSRLDRHQHIGAGNIGLEGFRYLVNHPILNKLPGILETPQTSSEDDRRNLATLRGLEKAVLV
ncbi:MAG: deoxyribonuclease IV [Bacillota bacterium]